MKTYQMAMLPGMAMTWYLVQLVVTSAALPSTVSSTAPYSAVPHTQWPAISPSPCLRSSYQNSSLPMYRMIEW